MSAAKAFSFLALLTVAACSTPGIPGWADDDEGAADDRRKRDGNRNSLHADGTEGAPGATPLVAFKGGTSIAIRWSSNGKGTDGVTKYVVQRNGKEVATVIPGFYPDFPEKDGKGYVDKDIEAGGSYEYRVQAVDANGTKSDVGAPLRVEAPPRLDAPPTIQFDTSRAPDLAELTLSAKAFLEIWYPKVAFALATPDYTPMSSFRIRFDPDYDGLAYADRAVPEIVVRAQWMRENPRDFGMFLHESTHLLNSAQGTPGWIVEGIADWTREYMLHDRDPKPIAQGQHYSQGYSQASFFLNWVQDKYDVPVVRTLTIASHKNAYAPRVFVEQTGKTIGKLWEELTGQKERDPGAVRWTDLPNKCIEGRAGRAEVATCNGSDAQAFAWGPHGDNDGTIWIEGPAGCLDVQSSGTAMGTAVGTYGCNGSGAQKWVLQPNGTLLNPNSGYCLDNPDGTTVDGTGLRIWDCNGSAAQRFTLPQ